MSRSKHPKVGDGGMAGQPRAPRTGNAVAGSNAASAAASTVVQLVHISRAGALVTSDSRLATGSHIFLKLNAADATFLLTGLVLRSKTSTQDGSNIRYESAIAFDDDFVLLDEDASGKVRRGSKAMPGAGFPCLGRLQHARSVDPTQSSERLAALIARVDIPGHSGMEIRRMLGL